MLAAFAGAILAVGAAAPASAGVYLYQNDQYLGGSHYDSGSNYTYHDGDTFSNGVHLYDNVTSVKNQTSYWTCFYVNHHYEGDGLALNSYVYSPNVGSYYNDKFSSHLVNC